MKIDKKFDFNSSAIEKFNNVQRSVFGLSFLGSRVNSISPQLQGFIFKTHSLSQLTFGLETTVLNLQTRNYLNICQNNILRQILGLCKNRHMSNILKSIKKFNFEKFLIPSSVLLII